MFHKNRRWQITDVPDAHTLAEKLTQHDWTGCTGFRLGGYLFLNDSTSPDGAQEYAVVKADNSVQVESITFGWCTPEKAEEYILQCLSGADDKSPWARKVAFQTHQVGESCRLCA